MTEVIAPTGEVVGTVRGRVAGYQHYPRPGAFPLAGLSLISLGTLNLIGLPSHLYRTMVDVEVEVFDRRNIRVGYYQAVGQDAYATGLYYRGWWSDHQRYSNAKAMRAALVDITRQIDQDGERLRTALAE